MYAGKILSGASISTEGPGARNSVKVHIWIAVSMSVLVAIIKKRLNLDASLYTLLQVFWITLFDLSFRENPFKQELYRQTTWH